MKLPGVLGARGRTAILAPLAALAAGCMTQDKVVPAINEVNQVFRNQYESILAQKGTRVFALPRGRTFAGVRAATSTAFSNRSQPSGRSSTSLMSAGF